MPNPENLIDMSKRSQEERKRLGSKGGKNSAEAKKVRKAMADILSQMINQPLPLNQKKARDALRKMGFTADEATNGALINLQLLNLALGGNVGVRDKLKAIEMIHKFVDGQKIDITTNGKDVKTDTVIVEVIDSREQVDKETEDEEQDTDDTGIQGD